MAIKLTANYAKRLGLPGFSSHQFSVTCETELTDLSQVPEEAARVYGLLQDSVDREMQQTGFVPDEEYGCRNASPGQPGNGKHPAHDSAPEPAWQCSDRQRELVTELAAELQLDAVTLDERSRRLFRRPAHELNKLCASGLISDLLAEAGIRRQREARNGSRGEHRHGNGNGHGRSRSGGMPIPSRRNGGAA